MVSGESKGKVKDGVILVTPLFSIATHTTDSSKSHIQIRAYPPSNYLPLLSSIMLRKGINVANQIDVLQ